MKRLSWAWVKLNLDSRLNWLLANSIFFFKFYQTNRASPSIVSHKRKVTLSQVDKSLLDLLDECIGEYSLLPVYLRRVVGMSGQRFRACLNRLGSATCISGHYLEVGTFRGSTAISALFGNSRKAFLIDNWSEFGGPKNKAIKFFQKFQIADRITLIDDNFDNFEASWLQGQPIGIYFYDGGHSFAQQQKAIQIIDTILFDTLILIVDDWCWSDVRNGTFSGLSQIKASILAEWQIFPSRKDKRDRHGNWHNGYYFCILKKDSL